MSKKLGKLKKQSEVTEEKPAKVSVKKIKAASKTKATKKATSKKTKKKVAAKLMKGPSGRVRTRTYVLPKTKESSEAKMDWQLDRLKERKLVSPKVKTLIGVKLIKRHNGKKVVVKGTKKGWLIKVGPKLVKGQTFTSLFGVACNVVNGPRNGYQFFGEQLKLLGKKPVQAEA